MLYLTGMSEHMWDRDERDRPQGRHCAFSRLCKLFCWILSRSLGMKKGAWKNSRQIGLAPGLAVFALVLLNLLPPL